MCCTFSEPYDENLWVSWSLTVFQGLLLWGSPTIQTVLSKGSQLLQPGDPAVPRVRQPWQRGTPRAWNQWSLQRMAGCMGGPGTQRTLAELAGFFSSFLLPTAVILWRVAVKLGRIPSVSASCSQNESITSFLLHRHLKKIFFRIEVKPNFEQSEFSCKMEISCSCQL